MKKTIVLSAIAAMVSVTAMADTQEYMMVQLKDGSTIEYNVADIEKVNFDVRTINYALTVTPADGEAAKYTAIPALLRVIPADESNPTLFGMGTVEASTAADLTTGDYGVYIALSPSKVYNGEIDLATDTESYTLKLVKYTEGGAEYILEEVTSGTLSSKLNSKNRKVTIELDAVMKDGTAVTASYEGTATDVESIEEMVPSKKYENEGFYYNESGDETRTAIKSVKASYNSSSKATTYTFNFDGYLYGQTSATMLIPDALVESGETEFSLPETMNWEFKFGYTIQLYGPTGNQYKDPYINIPDNGTMKFKKNADGSIEFFIEVQNYYDNYMGTHKGTPAKVIINYAGAVE